MPAIVNMDNVKKIIKYAGIGLFFFPLLACALPLLTLAALGALVEEVYKDFLK